MGHHVTTLSQFSNNNFILNLTEKHTQRSYLTLRTLQALHLPVRWFKITENSTSSPACSSRPSCTSLTWKNSFLLSPTSYVMKPNWRNKNQTTFSQCLTLSCIIKLTVDMSLPDLWRTPPGLCAEAQCCRPSFVLSGPLYTTETSPFHPFADNHLYWPYQRCRMDNSDPYWSLVKRLSREQLLNGF